jgi:hypothetical protein
MTTIIGIVAIFEQKTYESEDQPYMNCRGMDATSYEKS